MLSSLAVDLEGAPAFHPFYRTFTSTGGSTKRRRLFAPNESMRILHGRLNELLEPIVANHPQASSMTGCRPGNSPRTGLQRHRRHRFVYSIDLTDAFAQVDHLRLARIISVALVGPEMAPWLVEDSVEFIRKYCSSGIIGVVLGGPAVPSLFNLYCAELIDAPIAALCAKHGLTYSRFVDDMTFSSDSRIGRRIREQIRSVVTAAGFTTAHHKAKLVDLDRSNGVIITGLRLDRSGRISAPSHAMSRANGRLHLAAKGALPYPEAAGQMSFIIDSWKDNDRPLSPRERALLRSFRQLSPTKRPLPNS